MKISRKLLSIVLVVFALIGLISCTTKEEEGSKQESEKINLNIKNADIIASFTDNEKYLNKKYLFTINDLDDSDKVNIIVTLDQKGLLDSFNKNNKGFNSINEYSRDTYTINKQQKMHTAQVEFANKLIEEKLINKMNHSFTTLFNGFSAQTTYGKYKELLSKGYDIDITLSEVYTEPEVQLASTTDASAITNYVDVYETGIFNSSGVKYNGENTAVAILDSGFDIHHTVFQNMPNNPMITRSDVNDVLYESKAYGYHQNIKVQDVFMNDKIPFVYDYADKDPDVAAYDSNHGTHVAGIIGGKDDVITGVAINTQLVLMKVFGDVNNGALQDDILAALEDALLLGVDAINLSLGSACGFARSADNEYINVVYDKIEDAGISLVVAASNDYSSGYGGESSNTNKASNPDSATVGSPGTYESTIAVASISGVKSKYMVDESGYTFFFNNANNSAGEPYDFYDMIYESLKTGKDKVEVEYVTVPGVGKRINYSSIDVKGKIALVKRGETSFEEKAQVALSQGAIGCIIYNNIAGDVFMNAGSHLEIAFCSISKDDGEYLASKGTGKLILDKKYLAGPFMSEFSSWGPVSNLVLKPEITAHGGSILSSVPGGGYEEISGTSMACPNLCGVIILVRQALKERYPDITTVELNNMANSLLMSTSTIILDEQGNPYSPRKQGSGLGNLKYAIDTLAYLSVDGKTKPKLELKDDKEETGVYELVFDIKNISDQTLKYNLNNLTMTESLSTSDPKYVAEKAYMLNPNTSAIVEGDGSINGSEITVNPGGVATVKYTIKLTNEEKAYIRKSFINGIYVEGFAVLESLNEDGIDLSIPFLAFFGDWTVAPMFDKTYFEVESEAHNGAIDEEDKLKADYYATTPLAKYYHSYVIPMGTFVYDLDTTRYDPIPATEEHCAIGYNLNALNGITTVYAGLLRNAKKMTSYITNDETGEVLYEHVKYDEHKAYFSGSIVPGYDIINVMAQDLGLQNNTKYTFSMLAELDYEDGGLSDNLNNTFEFSFYVDYQAPIITNAEFYSKYDKSLKDYKYYVDVYVYDNHYAQSIRPFTIVDGKLVSLSEYVIPVYGERNDVSKVTIEITDYMDLLRYGVLEDGEFKISNGLGFLVDDYALNQSYSFVTLPGTNTSNISYKEDFYSRVTNGTYQFYKDIYTGDTIDLTRMLTSDDETLSTDPDNQARYFSNLNWTSSDESIIKVKNGQIEAVSAGTAIITCATMASDGYEYKINLRIRVRSKDVVSTSNKLTDIDFTYFETLKAFIDGPEISEIGEVGDKFFFTEKPYISCYPSEQVKLAFELEPWNLKDYELIWSSTNEKVAKVDENGVVTALKEGSSTITLKVKIDGRTSSLMATTKVIVKNEFIVEGNTLVAYKGLGGDVVIPDDEGILYIGSFAFSLYTTDYEVEIEDEDYDSAKTPSSNDSVISVTIPSDVLEVQKYAFYNCSSLETVNFLSDDEGDSCKIIREYAFAGDKKLKNINLEKVELVGSRAFYSCTGLVNIDLASTYAIGYEAFKDCTSLAYVDIIPLRNCGERAFENCTSLTEIKNGLYTNFSVGMFINSGLTKVEYYADRIPDNCFKNCKNLETVVIKRSIVYIGRSAFDDCNKLESVIFDSGAGSEFIYQNAFNSCDNLKTIVLPDSEVIIEENVFKNCKNLEKVVFNKNTYITENLGSIFVGCYKLNKFELDQNNQNYKVEGSLLLSNDGKSIILALPNNEYNEYVIDENIKEIKQSAFSNIDSLTKLTISKNVEIIHEGAFANCKNLTTLVLENKDVEIKDKAFLGCVSLSNIENINDIKVFNKYVFSNTAISSLNLSNAVSILEGAFSGCKLLTSINVTVNDKLGDYAFSNTPVETVIIDSKVIGKYAFSNCTKLNSIKMSDTVIIDEGAFINCSSIEKVIGEKVEQINDYAFANCTLLNSIDFNNVTEIGSYAFSQTMDEKSNLIVSINLPDTLTKIGAYAFANSTNLKNVEIGSGLKEIGEYAFYNCGALESVKVIGIVEQIKECTFQDSALLNSVQISGVKYIEGGAFLNCSALSKFDFDSVIRVGVQAFENCTNLSKAIMPNVVALEDGAFLNATNLTEVSMPKVESIGFQALSCIGVTNIIIPSTIKFISRAAFNYNQNQVSFTDSEGIDTTTINDYVVLDQGVLYTRANNNKLVLNTYPTSKEGEEYVVLFNTVRIDEYAGYFNKNIKRLVFPDTLELIGNMSFYGCTKINQIEFRSTTAPIFEGTVSDVSFEYGTSSEIYKFLNKYFQFNGYYPLFYAQFKDMIGLASKMKLIIPSNANKETYEDILYTLYFDEVEVSEYEALNDRSIEYLNKVSMIPSVVTLNDEAIINDAKTAYNQLNQDLTKYGYSLDYLEALSQKLNEADSAWTLLKMNRINKVYAHIIKDIENLGSSFEFNKIKDYYNIIEALDIVDRNDIKYIDQTNVESFKKGFDDYFNHLNEDIRVITEITTLPTTKVNKVGYTVLVGSGLSLGVVLLILRRKFFI